MEFYEQSNGEVIRFFTSRDAVFRFRVRLAVFRTDCRMTPPHCCSGSILLLACLLLRVPSTSAAASNYANGAFLGVYLSPSSRHLLQEAFLYVPGLPHPDTFAPLAFLTLSTLFASRSVVDLFHSTATSRVHLQGFFPLTQELKLIVPTCSVTSVHRQLPVHSCPCTPASSDAALTAFLHVRIWSSPTRGISPSQWSIPSWFFLLQVFSRNSVPVPSHLQPPSTIHAHLSQSSTHVVFGAPPSRLACLSQGCLPARGSWPASIPILRL